jgi:cation diffusion facilitator CzcD-associated flavoprotein CzcO
MDNAAVALEHGATVDLFCRRRPTGVQRYRWLTFAGFLRHMSDVPDLWRWRIMGNIMRAREGFPPDTYARVMAFPDSFTMHAERGWTDARMEGDRVRIETTRGPFHADFVICGTGIRQDVRLRPELAPLADKIALWSDRFTPPPGEEDALLANYPYLGTDYQFLEKTPGEAPWLGDIHLFGIGSTLSFGVSGSSINGMTIAVPKLVSSLTRGLFAGDLQRHWQSLLAYDTKVVDIDWSRVKTG